MSQVRDNLGVSGGNVPTPPTDTDTQGLPPGTDVDAAAPTQALANLRHERHEKDFQTKQQDFQSDFLKKLGDPPGFGANEDGDAKKLKTAMTDSGLPVPSGQQVQQAQNAIGQTEEFQSAVTTVKDALNGDAPVPTGPEMHTMLTKIGAADSTGGLTVPVAGSGTNPPVPGAGNRDAAAAPKTLTTIQSPDTAAPKAAAQEKREFISSLPATSNISALVFLVTLQSQRETVKEKNDVLRKIKMFNGMLDQVNKLVNSQLIPAQKMMADMRDKGKDQKDFKPDQIQVPVNWPSSIDTDNASMNAETGEVVLNASWTDGKGGPSRRLVNSTDLNTLISQADQTRTTIQNNQTQQSNRFQSKDNQMSAAWNILNAVLKNTHDGVSSTVKNI